MPEWDLVGNLKKRRDVNQSNLTEEFFYDNLYRLGSSTLNGVTNLAMGYDALGNIEKIRRGQLHLPRHQEAPGDGHEQRLELRVRQHRQRDERPERHQKLLDAIRPAVVARQQVENDVGIE